MIFEIKIITVSNWQSLTYNRDRSITRSRSRDSMLMGLSDIEGDNDVTKKLKNHMRKANADLNMLPTLKETTEEAEESKVRF